MYPEDSDRIRRMTPEERRELRRELTEALLMSAYNPGIYEQLELLDALEGRPKPEVSASGWALLALAVVVIIATLYAVNGG